MPEKSSSVISYAAGASLAAVALIYVFGPNFTLDHDSASSRKKTIVGLRNQANDCFINSVLQALAGLGELRVYLIRETHRRRIEDPRVYAHLVQPDGTDSHGYDGDNALPLWKLQGLQDGLVSQGLKEMLDALNERPLARKAISPFPFVRVLEAAFKQRISRQQQDAQEFLQIVAERLKDEYHAGQRARSHARLAMALDASTGSLGSSSGRRTSHNNNNNDDDDDDDDDEKRALAEVASIGFIDGDRSAIEAQLLTEGAEKNRNDDDDDEEGFPLEGKYESHIKCQSCGYTTKPREESFCSLTLAVPQVASTSLNACFDGIFKTEYIDDFKCEMCRLLQAKTRLEQELERLQTHGLDSTTEAHRAAVAETIEKLRWAIEHDPEHAPEGVELGDTRLAPRTRIAKTTRMVTFPKILAVHLSRSIYDIGRTTQKNSASVAFPEQLPLGGLMQQRRYKLLGLVTHRGGHNSGHYEAFRRQNAPSPYANSNTFRPSGIYSKSKTPTPLSTPEISARRSASPAMSTPELLSASSASASDSSSSSPSLSSLRRPRLRRKKTENEDKDKDGETSSLRSVAASTKSALSRLASGGRSEKEKHSNGNGNGNGNANGSAASSPSPSPPPPPAVVKHGRKKKQPGADKWWRVSDEKVKEAKTSEVLGMQKEVYLLFYELERDA